MTVGTALDLGRMAIMVAIEVCAPVLLIGLLTGLVISILQAITSIQEPTLAFIPKIGAIALALLFLGPYMLTMLTDFTGHIFLLSAHFPR